MSILIKNSDYRTAFLLCISICVFAFIKSYLNITLLAYAVLLLIIICIFKVKIKCVLPVMLFLLPWARILKVDSSSITFLTLILPFVLFRILATLKEDLKLDFLSLSLLFFLFSFSLLGSLISGYDLGTSTLGFFVLLFYMLILLSNKELLPSRKETTYLFALSLIIAFAAGMVLQGLPHMSEYFKIAHVSGDSFLSRFSSLNFDPNYNALQVAMGISMLMIKMSEDNKRNLSDLVILFLLIGIGILSLSKMFIIMLIALTIIWILSKWDSKISGSRKILIIVFMAVAAIYSYYSGILSEQINAYIYRFASATDISTLTSRRSLIQVNYLNYIFDNPIVLFLGSGFSTNASIGYASHNTYIQIIFQIGIFGAIMLIIFIIKFMQQMKPTGQKLRTNRFLPLISLMLGAGALDLLLMDEFVYYIIICGVVLLNEPGAVMNCDDLVTMDKI